MLDIQEQSKNEKNKGFVKYRQQVLKDKKELLENLTSKDEKIKYTLQQKSIYFNKSF